MSIGDRPGDRRGPRRSDCAGSFCGVAPNQIRLTRGFGSDRRASVDYESIASRSIRPNREAFGVFCRTCEASLTTDADRSSFFIGLVIVDIFVGLADAISLPYIVLFLVDKAGLSPLSLSAILTARAASSIAFSWTFGAWIDKRTTLKPLILALAGSTIGYGLLGFTTNFLALMIIAALPIAIGAAAFSQSVALVKRCFDRSSPHTVNRAIGVMRASWSLAWAFGPMVGAVIVGAAGFRGAFLASGGSAWPHSRPSPSFVRRRFPAKRLSAIRRGGSHWRIDDRARLRGSRPVLHGHVSEPVRVSDRAHDVARRRDKRRRDRDEPMRSHRDRRHGRDHLAAAEARRAHRDRRRLCRFRRLLSHARARGQRGRRLLGAGPPGGRHRSRHLSRDQLPPLAHAASRRRRAALFSNAGQLGSVLAALSVGGLAKAFGYASIFVVCAFLSAAGLALVCLTPAEPD